MGLKLINAPSEEPISLDQAKLQCRVDGNADDALLTGIIIPAARRAAEIRTGRALVTQTWELALDVFPASEIELLMPPVQSVSSIKYLDPAGVERTLDAQDYALDNYGSMRHWVIPAAGAEWPDTLAAANAVKVHFVAGYGLAVEVPADIKAWIQLAIGTLYAYRENVAQGQLVELPGGFWQSLLDPYVLYSC